MFGPKVDNELKDLDDGVLLILANELKQVSQIRTSSLMPYLGNDFFNVHLAQKN